LTNQRYAETPKPLIITKSNVNDIWKEEGKDISVARVLGTASSRRGEKAATIRSIDLAKAF
jgi:hypothetical protein